MPVPVIGISTLPTEMTSCEETEEKSTLFTLGVDGETDEESCCKPSLRFTSVNASDMACS